MNLEDLKINSEIVPGSKPQRFREGGRLHKNIRIYLDPANDADLDDIISVDYELHPTFKDRYRSSENRSRNFETRIWTYGYFKIKAILNFKDGSKKVKDGFVRWSPKNRS